MMRLVKAGLMFGNLIEVRSTALVERYNRALEHLTGKQTKLTDFHIDISGYSPEIGDELGDTLYLNPNGCNRQFILLTTDQKTAPLLEARFSTSRMILREFIEENEEQLFALTAREAVAGELVNSVFKIKKPKDLFNIKQIEVEADTVQSHVEEAKALETQIDRFLHDDDAWWDDVLIADMVETAKRTGNIQRNPVDLSGSTVAQGNFFTEHFDGLYVFRNVEFPFVIARDPNLNSGPLPVESATDFKDPLAIATALHKNHLVEPLVSSKSARTAAILKQKIDFITIGVAAEQGADLSVVSRRDMRVMMRQYVDHMPPEFFGLLDIYRWATEGGDWPEMTAEHPAFFYAMRAAQGPNRDLVNMLLADLTPRDFRQLFICHKQAFYDAYRDWSDAKKTYVAQFLAQEYAIDKAGARDELFGPEPEMDESPDASLDDLISRVGPWGPVRRKR